jgi:nicotinamide-nucleotide amidase
MKNPRIEIVAIGNEVLAGAIINSNSTFISHELSVYGFKVRRQTVLPDDADELRSGLSQALKHNDIVICTGGLGPTLDDNTRQMAAELFDSGMHLDKNLLGELQRRYGERISALANLENQATIPDKAGIFLNPIGTAPGIVFETDERCLILLPGVPLEMKRMVTEELIPYMTMRHTASYISKRVHLFNLFESQVDPKLRELKAKYPKIEFGIYPSLGLVTISFMVEDPNDLPIIEAAQHDLLEIYPFSHYESPSGKIEEAVHMQLIEKKLTLSLAESCTGGALAARLTQLPDASKYLLGSIVAYSNALKTQLLGVSESVLKEHGAVSAQTATEMVLGVQQLTGSDYAIAVTGIAGPGGGTPEKPVGTVWGAIIGPDHVPHVWKVPARGSRAMIIEGTVNKLLVELYQQLR